jgi:hypothetical protein
MIRTEEALKEHDRLKKARWFQKGGIIKIPVPGKPGQFTEVERAKMADINFFKDLPALEDLGKAIQAAANEQKALELYQKHKGTGFTELFRNQSGYVIELLTHEASREMFCRPTTVWCTAWPNEDNWNHYIRKGRLIILADLKAQIYIQATVDRETGQITDILNQRDVSASSDEWDAIDPDLVKYFKDYTEVDENTKEILKNPERVLSTGLKNKSLSTDEIFVLVNQCHKQHYIIDEDIFADKPNLAVIAAAITLIPDSHFSFEVGYIQSIMDRLSDSQFDRFIDLLTYGVKYASKGIKNGDAVDIWLSGTHFFDFVLKYHYRMNARQIKAIIDASNKPNNIWVKLNRWARGRPTLTKIMQEVEALGNP